MAIDDKALLAAIDAGRENAYGSDTQSVIGQKRAKAIEYYLGLNTNPAPEGRSQVVDRSVYETVSVMLPSLVRIFAGSSEEVCKAVAIGPDDEPAAEQQTAVLNYIVTQQNQWEQICSDWIHDAMLLCNGYCMAYWDESDTSVREVYEGQSDDQLASLLQDESVQIVQHSETVDKEATQQAQQQYQQAMSMGIMLDPPQPVMLHDVVIERRENEGKVCIKVLPPEHCYVSIDTPDWTLKESPFFEYRCQKTIAELRAMGLDVAEDVSDNEREDADEDWARDRFGENNDDEEKGVMRRVWARMIWVRADAEGDGESRLYYVIAVGRTILFSEPVSRIPVASMTPQPLPHRHIGMAVGETVHDIQDIRTAIKRGGLDNLYLANNGRHIVSSRVNLGDMLQSRPGGLVRMTDDSLPEGHVIPLDHPFAFGEIVQSLEYFDQDRQNRTGASRYFSGTDAGAINKTASGTMALQNMASMRIEHTARMMAPAVEYLFSAVQEIFAKHQNKALTIKLRAGQWVTVDPQAWRTKRDLRISVGVGAGNKDSMIAQLGMIYGAQLQLMPVGLAGPEQIHATVTEMGKLAGFANPGKFWVNPSENPPPPPPPDPEVVKLQMEAQIAERKAQLDEREAQMELQIKERMAQLEERLKLIDVAIKERELEFKGVELKMKGEQQAMDLQIKGQQQAMGLQADSAKHSMNLEAAEKKHQITMEEAKLPKPKQEGKPQDIEKIVAKAIQDYMDGSRVVGIEKIRGKDGKVTAARKKYANGKTEDVTIQ